MTDLQTTLLDALRLLLPAIMHPQTPVLAGVLAGGIAIGAGHREPSWTARTWSGVLTGIGVFFVFVLFQAILGRVFG